jgi:hypothetical protein
MHPITINIPLSDSTCRFDPSRVCVPPHALTYESLCQGAALQLWDTDTPVYTAPCMLPPSKLKDASIESSLVGRGCCIVGSTVKSSILGDCTRVREGCVIEVSPACIACC